MDSEEQFWLKTWQTIAVTLMVITVSFVAYYSYRNYLYEKAAEAGVDILTLACANSNGNEPLCIVHTTNQGKTNAK